MVKSTLSEIRRRHPHFADDAAPGKKRTSSGILLIVVNVKQLVCFKSRMERQAQQAFFIVHKRLSVYNVQELFRVASVRSFLATRIRPSCCTTNIRPDPSGASLIQRVRLSDMEGIPGEVRCSANPRRRPVSTHNKMRLVQCVRPNS